jgi:hypothetical protein
MSAKKSTKKKTANDLSNLLQEAERKKNMKIARQTIGPTPSQGPVKKGSRDEQESDGSANVFKDK